MSGQEEITRVTEVTYYTPERMAFEVKVAFGEYRKTGFLQNSGKMTKLILEKLTGTSIPDLKRMFDELIRTNQELEI